MIRVLVRKISILSSILLILIVACMFHILQAEAKGMVGSEGMGHTAGYEIVGPSYTLDPGDPTILDSVEFTIQGVGEPSLVMVKLMEGGSWHACDLTVDARSTQASCTLNSERPTFVSEMDGLRVVASR
jgi:hypothetical protein